MQAPNRIKKLLLEMEQIKGQQKKLDERYTQLRQLFLDNAKQQNTDHFFIDDGSDKLLKITVRDQPSYGYDTKLLRELIGQELFRQVTELTVDHKKVEALRELGKIDLEKYKEAIIVETRQTVNVTRVYRNNPEEEE